MRGRGGIQGNVVMPERGVDRKTDVRRFGEGLYPPRVYAGEEEGETKIRIKTKTCHGRLAGIIQDDQTHVVLSLLPAVVCRFP